MTRLLAALLALCLAAAAQAQTFPAKPITIVLSYAAGGPTDFLARTLAEKVSAAAVSMMAMAVGVVSVGVSLAAVMFTAKAAVLERAQSETVSVKDSLLLALKALMATAFGV